jgi:hypothetical protein
MSVLCAIAGTAIRELLRWPISAFFHGRFYFLRGEIANDCSSLGIEPHQQLNFRRGFRTAARSLAHCILICLKPNSDQKSTVAPPD